MELTPRRGYLLIITLLAGGALLFLGVVVLRFVSDRNQMTSRLEREWVAEGAALAGLERARLALSKDPKWTAGLEADEPHSRGHASITFAPSARGGWSTGNVNGDPPVKGFDGRVVPPGFVHVVSTGTSGASTFTTQAMLCVRGALLDDTFDEGGATSRPEWTQVRGSDFRVDGGCYTLGGPSEHLTLTGSDDWRDYKLEAWAWDRLDAMVERNQGAFTLLARAEAVEPGDLRQGGALPAIQWGYDAVHDEFIFSQSTGAPGSPEPRPQRIARASTLLRTLPRAWYCATFHRFFIRAVGDRVECGVDDVPVFTAQAHPARAAGRIGLMVGPNAFWLVDRVKVTNLSGAVYTARW